MVMLKERDLNHITGRHRGSANRNCNIKVKLNLKIPVVFHNLKNMNPILLRKN